MTLARHANSDHPILDRPDEVIYTDRLSVPEIERIEDALKAADVWFYSVRLDRRESDDTFVLRYFTWEKDRDDNGEVVWFVGISNARFYTAEETKDWPDGGT